MFHPDLVLLNISNFVFSDFYKIQKCFIMYQFGHRVTYISAATWHYDVIILLVYITLESPVQQMLWSSNLHQRYSLTKDADWWVITLVTWPTCILQTEIIFPDINKNWKMMSSINVLFGASKTSPSLINFSKIFQPGYLILTSAAIKYCVKFHLTQAFKIYTCFG